MPTALATLPALMKNRGDIELRRRMALAALTAGLAFSNTRTAAPAVGTRVADMDALLRAKEVSISFAYPSCRQAASCFRSGWS